MNDELLPAAELAGDLLDGDVDGQARAAASATDASVTALAEQFRAVRHALSDVPAAPDAQRDAAIAAALAVFDHTASLAVFDHTASLAATEAAPAAVMPLARRNARRWYQVASIAAAVALVGVIGTIAIDRMGGSDLDSPGMADTSSKEGFNAERSSADPPAGGSDGGVAVAESTAAAQTATPDSAPVPTIDSIGGPADFLVPVNSPAELLSYAQQRQAESADETLISSSCPTDGAVLLDAVRYQGVEALVWVETSTGNVQAVDAITCEVLETVTP
jgi:hypothetical protein